MFGKLFEIFIYSACYFIILTLGTKIFGSMISPEFEKRILEGGGFVTGIMISSIIIGLSLIVSAVISR